MITDKPKSRTEYKRNWRYTHPDNVRKNKKTSYWNNPEKHRKKSRETYHKNKNSSKKGKSTARVAVLSNSSPTTIFRIMYVEKYARELYETLGNKSIKEVKVYPIYTKVRQDVISFTIALVKLFDKIGRENVTEQDIKEIAVKYETLTFPFDVKDK